MCHDSTERQRRYWGNYCGSPYGFFIIHINNDSEHQLKYEHLWRNDSEDRFYDGSDIFFLLSALIELKPFALN